MPKIKKNSVRDTKMRNSKIMTSPLNLSFIHSIPNKKLFFLAPILSLITIALVILLRSFLPPQVPLFYGLPEGEEQLASSLSLIIPSFIALVVFVVNTALIFALDDSYVENTLVVTTFAVSLFSSITIIQIIVLIHSIAF